MFNLYIITDYHTDGLHMKIIPQNDTDTQEQIFSINLIDKAHMKHKSESSLSRQDYD